MNYWSKPEKLLHPSSFASLFAFNVIASLSQGSFREGSFSREHVEHAQCICQYGLHVQLNRDRGEFGDSSRSVTRVTVKGKPLCRCSLPVSRWIRWHDSYMVNSWCIILRHRWVEKTCVKHFQGILPETLQLFDSRFYLHLNSEEKKHVKFHTHILIVQ